MLVAGDVNDNDSEAGVGKAAATKNFTTSGGVWGRRSVSETAACVSFSSATEAKSSLHFSAYSCVDG